MSQGKHPSPQNASLRHNRPSLWGSSSHTQNMCNVLNNRSTDTVWNFFAGILWFCFFYKENSWLKANKQKFMGGVVKNYPTHTIVMPHYAPSCRITTHNSTHFTKITDRRNSVWTANTFYSSDNLSVRSVKKHLTGKTTKNYNNLGSFMNLNHMLRDMMVFCCLQPNNGSLAHIWRS